MPIEIRELHIRVAINDSPSGKSSDARRGVDGGAVSEADNENRKGAIVVECVEQVLQILERKMER